ncbi:MAG: hypothetical protein ACRD63_04760, partial [Pyrinomonadaceae bacterium]
MHEVSVTDENGNRRSTVYTYTSFNNVLVVSERGFGGEELRRTETTYETNPEYTNRGLLRIPFHVRVYDGVRGILVSAIDMGHDQFELTGYGDIAQYSDPGAFRGNLTHMIQYADPANGGGAKNDFYKYDIAGNLLAETVSCCQQRVYQYSSEFQHAYPTNIARGNAGQFQSQMGYDFNTGLPRTTTDENGQTTTIHYYAENLREFQIVRPDGSTTTNQYVDAFQFNPDSIHRNTFVITRTKIDGARESNVVTSFDGRGAAVRTFGLSSNGWITTDVEYDVMGRTLRQSSPYYNGSGISGAINPSGQWTSNTYDGLGRVTQTVLPDRTSVKSFYSGNVTTVEDQAGRQRRSVADALGRIIRVDEPDKSSGNLGDTNAPLQYSYYDYDAQDNLIRITQGEQTRYFRYDGLGRATHERSVEQAAPHNFFDPVTGNSAWSSHVLYNDQGLVTDSFDARGVQTHILYDGVNRPVQISYSDGTPSVTNTYDQPRSGFSNNGRLTRVETTAVTATAEEYDYDLMGRAVKYRQIIAGSSFETGYTYDQLGQLVSERYPSGRVVNHPTDGFGRATGVKDQFRTYTSGLEFQAHGGLSRVDYGNGASAQMAYNNRQQMVVMQLNRSGLLQSYEYRYGQVDMNTGDVDTTKNTGQVARIDSLIDFKKQWQQRYQYDRIGRLATAGEYRGDNGAQVWQQNYQYDRYGNLAPHNLIARADTQQQLMGVPQEAAQLGARAWRGPRRRSAV